MRVPAARKKVRFCLELDEVRRGYVGEAACGWVVNDNNSGVQEVIDAMRRSVDPIRSEQKRNFAAMAQSEVRKFTVPHSPHRREGPNP